MRDDMLFVTADRDFARTYCRYIKSRRRRGTTTKEAFAVRSASTFLHSLIGLLTFGEPPQLLGAEDAGGRDGVVADDPVVRVVHEAGH